MARGLNTPPPCHQSRQEKLIVNKLQSYRWQTPPHYLTTYLVPHARLKHHRPLTDGPRTKYSPLPESPSHRPRLARSSCVQPNCLQGWYFCSLLRDSRVSTAFSIDAYNESHSHPPRLVHSSCVQPNCPRGRFFRSLLGETSVFTTFPGDVYNESRSHRPRLVRSSCVQPDCP